MGAIRTIRSRIACQRCRSLKHKCDFEFPKCGRCTKSGEPCLVEDPITKELVLRDSYHRQHKESKSYMGDTSTLERRIRKLEDKVERYEGILEDMGIDVSQAGQQKPAKANFNLGEMTLLSLIPFKGASAVSGMKDEITRLSVFGENGAAQQSGEMPAALPKTRAECDTVLSHYYRLAWVQHPIVENENALYLISQCHYSSGRLSSWESFLLYIALAIGKAIAGESGSLITQYYFSAVMFLKRFLRSIPVMLQNYADRQMTVRMQVRSIQALLLICSFGLLKPVSPGIWYIISTAMRLCIDMDLQEESALVRLDSGLSTSLHRRLFWSCYALDRQICCYANKPFTLDDVDITTKMIEPIDHLQVSALFIQTRKFQSMIHQFIYKEANTAIHVDQWRQGMHMELNSWLARVIDCDTSSKDFLVLTYFQLTQMLYRPVSSKIREGSHTTSRQFQILFDCARKIIDIYEQLDAQNHINYKYLSIYSIYQSGLTFFHCLINCPELSAHQPNVLELCNTFMARVAQILRNSQKDCPFAANIERTLHKLLVSTTAIVGKRLEDMPPTTHIIPSVQHTYGAFDTHHQQKMAELGAIPLIEPVSETTYYQDDPVVSAQILRDLSLEDMNIPPSLDFGQPNDQISTANLWEFLYEEPFSLKGMIL